MSGDDERVGKARLLEVKRDADQWRSGALVGHDGVTMSPREVQLVVIELLAWREAAGEA